MKNPIRFIPALFILLLCAGCINYEEEMYLNEDLSGRVEICVFPNIRPALTSAIQKTGHFQYPA